MCTEYIDIIITTATAFFFIAKKTCFSLFRLLAEVNKKRENEGLFKVMLHTDAAQAIGKVPVDVTDLNIDYLTMVGHKVSNFLQCM